MSKIKIKNLGPITEGLLGGEEYLDFKKCTIIIGNQATGKSTIAKIISTITWIEKSLYKKEIEVSEVTKYRRFRNKYCAYQGLKDYFRYETYIEYIGDYITLTYSEEKTRISIRQDSSLRPPKIMYVPAERNFLSVVDEPGKLKYLPSPLYTFLEEFEIAKRQNQTGLPLPINDITFEYQKQTKTSYVKGDHFRVKLSKASSGIQSLLPLYLVSKYLSENINSEQSASSKSISVDQERQLRKEIDNILSNRKINSEIREILISRLSDIDRNQCFINIVEEPEQNLFPESQKRLLYNLLQFANATEGNKLLITTHSPYILNYVSICIKGHQVKQLLMAKDSTEVKEKLFSSILPMSSTISSDEVVIYELKHPGIIHRLSEYNGIPSDNNYLNNILKETNMMFGTLMEIEEEVE